MAHLLCLGLLSRYAHEVKVMGDTIDLANDISDRYRRNDERLDKVQSELVALQVGEVALGAADPELATLRGGARGASGGRRARPRGCSVVCAGAPS